jgi:UDP-N-acetylmuramoyl-L-alanyl-D-glutamate--2,6-diaminopimelate ligase
VRLDELINRLTAVRLVGDGDLEVQGITHDSRRVQQGWIFAALPGQRAHGLEFFDAALTRGACAVLTDRTRPAGIDLPWIETLEPRRAMAEAAWVLAGDPQRELQIVGITGTNGKSTTAHLLSLIFEADRRRAAFFGTLGYFLPSGDRLPADRTTPEATDLAPLFRRTVADRGQVVAMEVSSHALMMDRLAGLRFQVAVWTNLSRDHLDFHGDMDSYFRAKRRLFDEYLAEDGRRVLPLDDEWGARLLDEPRNGDVSWGLSRGMVHAREVRADLGGTEFELVLENEVVGLRLPLIGVHNLRNALAAAAGGLAADVGSEAIQRGLEQARPLRGRLEPVTEGRGFPVFVDYAHTPGGLRTVLEALRELTDRRLIVVFGAGGDRDVGKREPMGYAVGELADMALVTSDNPRSEDPERIAAAVADGVRAAGAEPVVELDRRRAIETALAMADERSLVLVAGKGHEATQTIGDRQLPFSDQEVILELVEGVRCA